MIMAVGIKVVVEKSENRAKGTTKESE